MPNGEYMILWRAWQPQIYLPGPRLKNDQGNCAQDIARHKLYILLCAGFVFLCFLFSIRSIFLFPIFGSVLKSVKFELSRKRKHFQLTWKPFSKHFQNRSEITTKKPEHGNRLLFLFLTLSVFGTKIGFGTMKILFPSPILFQQSIFFQGFFSGRVFNFSIFFKERFSGHGNKTQTKFSKNHKTLFKFSFPGFGEGKIL